MIESHELIILTLIGTIVQVVVVPLLGIIWWMLNGRIAELRDWLRSLQASREAEQEKFVRADDCRREHDRLAATIKEMSEHIADLVYRKLDSGLRNEVNDLSTRVRRLESKGDKE